MVGCQRSGTTLTGQILGAPGRATLVDETDGLYPWFSAVAHADRRATRMGFAMLAKSARKYIEPDQRTHPAQAGPAVDSGPIVLVLKAPNLTYDAKSFSSIPVPVTIVYPVRDPRAVVASMLRLSEVDFVSNQLRLLSQRPHMRERYAQDCDSLADAAKPLIARLATIWKIKSALAHDFRSLGLPVHQFAYERLALHPHAAISELMRFCDLQPNPGRSAEQVYRGYAPGGTDRTRAVDATSLSTWRTMIGQQDEDTILHVAQPVAEQLGYG